MKSPVWGEVMELQDLEDKFFLKIFKDEVVAIQMNSMHVVSPVTGVVEFLIVEEQMIGITSSCGRALIIHLEKKETEKQNLLYYVEVGNLVDVGELLFQREQVGGECEKPILYLLFSQPFENEGIARSVGEVDWNEDLLVIKK